MRFSLTLGTALAMAVTLASPVGAQPAEPVRVMTTRTLAELCGLPAANPNKAAAQGFCGASSSAPGSTTMKCRGSGVRARSSACRPLRRRSRQRRRIS